MAVCREVRLRNWSFGGQWHSQTEFGNERKFGANPPLPTFRSPLFGFLPYPIFGTLESTRTSFIRILEFRLLTRYFSLRSTGSMWGGTS